MGDRDEKLKKNHNKLLTTDLSLQQKRFCEEYLVDLKGGEAYIRAGYKTRSQKSANSAACRLLANVSIQKELDRLRKERGRETTIDSNRVLTELGIIGLSNILDYIDFDENDPNRKPVIKPPSQWKHPQAVAEFSVTTFRGETKSVFKLHNKIEALKMLATHAGLLCDLNTALNTLRRYGYEIEETEEGLFCRDTYISDRVEIKQMPAIDNN
jgi:phage terminase small subunit